MQREEAIRRKKRAEEWDAQHAEVLLSCFHYQRVRAEMAARRAAGNERRQAIRSESLARPTTLNERDGQSELALSYAENPAMQPGTPLERNSH